MTLQLPHKLVLKKLVKKLVCLALFFLEYEENKSNKVNIKVQCEIMLIIEGVFIEFTLKFMFAYQNTFTKHLQARKQQIVIT